jgi:hypothetical protein
VKFIREIHHNPCNPWLKKREALNKGQVLGSILLILIFSHGEPEAAGAATKRKKF